MYSASFFFICNIFRFVKKYFGLPPPAPAGIAGPDGPHLLPAMVPAFHPFMGMVASRARSTQYRRAPSTRLLWATAPDSGWSG